MLDLIDSRYRTLLEESYSRGRELCKMDDVLQWRLDHGIPDAVSSEIADFVLQSTSLFDMEKAAPDYFEAALAVEGLSRAAGAALPITLEFMGALSLKVLEAPRRMEQCAAYYKKYGRFPFAFASTEFAGGSNARPHATHVERAGEKYILNGRKAYVNNGEFCPLLLVSANDDEAQARGVSHTTTLWLIDQSVVGVRAVPIRKNGQEMIPFADVTFTNVELEESDCLLAASRVASHKLSTIRDIDRVIDCASCLGLAEAAMDDACDRVTQRHSFDRPISEYQLVREMIVRMEAGIESMRALLYDAVIAMGAGRDYRGKLAVAKWFIPQTSVSIASDALQLFGALGYTSQERVFGIWTDCRGYQITSGTDQVMVDVAAPEVIKKHVR